jgi:hypothetical protein
MLKNHHRGIVLILAGSVFSNGNSLFAGMPGILPTNYVIKSLEVTTLTQFAKNHLNAASFFLCGLLLTAFLIQLLWNSLQKDFRLLYRLSYFNSLIGTVLWGLFFIVVLTMISGARELMTPGAWKKNGITYKLTQESEKPIHDNRDKQRKEHLEKLRTYLWRHAALNKGEFPSASEVSAIPAAMWMIPFSANMKYLYQDGKKVSQNKKLLVIEPQLENNKRLVLCTNGEILSLTSSEINIIKEGEEI